MNKFDLHIAITAYDSNVIPVLNQHCDLTNAELKQAISKGALWLTRGKSTQRLRRVKKTLALGDTLHFYYDEKILSQQPNEALLIADLHDYSVWYKPYGMLSQGSKWSDHCTIARWVQNHLTPERSVFIVHRLDRAATGLILIGHSKNAAQLLSKMFEQHHLEKHYQIIIHGDHRQRPQPDRLTAEIDGKSASSSFSHIDYDKQHNMSLVSVKIDSGRKHQIRKHAQGIDMPVVGDRLYGKSGSDQASNEVEKLVEEKTAQVNLQLCAVSLSFTCPISQEKRSFILPEQLRPSLAVLTKQLA